MNTEIGAYKAKTQFSALLERAERGEQITITKHGRPVARLVPIANADLERRRAAIARIKELRKGLTLGVPVKQLIEEGRR